MTTTKTTTAIDVEAFAHAYMICAAWLPYWDVEDDETDGETRWDDYCRARNVTQSGARAGLLLTFCSPDVIAAMMADAKDFAGAYGSYLADTFAAHPHYTEEQSGHDFLLTRNGHGAGFWDRGLGVHGDYLTKAAKAWGDFTLLASWDDNGDPVIYCG